jgi:hypothetical protein
MLARVPGVEEMDRRHRRMLLRARTACASRRSGCGRARTRRGVILVT